MGLNPQIAKVEIGTKETREITIYPLSMRDQFNMTDTVVEAVMQFANVDTGALKDEEIIKTMISLIEDNIEKLLVLVLDQDEEVTLSDMTNDQFTVICETIYETNYEGSIKKLQDLVGKIKTRMRLPGTVVQETEQIDSP